MAAEHIRIHQTSAASRQSQLAESLYKDLIGAPYKFGGKSKEEGFDCWSLAVEIFKRAGFDIEASYEFANLSSLPGDFSILADYNWQEVKGALQPLDIIVFQTGKEGEAKHIGIYLGEHKVLEALERNGVVVSKLRPYRRIRKVYRWHQLS